MNFQTLWMVEIHTGDAIGGLVCMRSSAGRGCVVSGWTLKSYHNSVPESLTESRQC